MLSSVKINRPVIPKKYQPRGFMILHEDQDLIVGIKSAGFLTVAAAWDRENSVHAALRDYVRKGNARSTKEIYVVHRLDQATSGLLVFAKSIRVQEFLKENWKSTEKIYFTIVHGQLKVKKGRIESYLAEDDDYMVRSTDDSLEGRLAQTEYEVLQESKTHSLVKISLLTGRKNQIRVHMADLGHPVVGDSKYAAGGEKTPGKVIREIALHAHILEFTHPHSKERYHFEAPLPDLFTRLIPNIALRQRDAGVATQSSPDGSSQAKQSAPPSQSRVPPKLPEANRFASASSMAIMAKLPAPNANRPKPKTKFKTKSKSKSR